MKSKPLGESFVEIELRDLDAGQFIDALWEEHTLRMRLAQYSDADIDEADGYWEDDQDLDLDL